jgi:hypothetical protein
MISVMKSTSYKLGVNVCLVFQIVQHSKDELLMRSFIDYFGCGNCIIKRDYSYYVVTKFSDNYEKILPFFINHPIIGVKLSDFKD